MSVFPFGPFHMGERTGTLLRCPHCGRWTPSDKDVCTYCGLPLEPPRSERFCPDCGEDLPLGARWCPYCGRPLVGPGLRPAIRILLCVLSILPPVGVWAVGVLWRSPNPTDRAMVGWIFLISLTGTALLFLALALW